MALGEKLDRLNWYVSRLMVMSPPEILHRFREKRAKRELAGWQGGWESFDRSCLVQTDDFAWLAQRLAQAPGSMINEWLTSPDHLGLSWKHAYPCGKNQDIAFWHYDPVSGNFWPGAGASCFAAPVRFTSARPHAVRPFGDVKFVWEPNRLQALMPLAAIIARKGEDAGQAQIAGVELITSWMEANPPFRGVNWFSGIEISLRICSVVFFVAAARNLDELEQRNLARFIAAHAHWLTRMPSLYSSANNHRVAEGLGLLAAGALLPDYREASAWSAEGRHILQTECLLQILEDGVGGEQSPTYQAFTMELIGFGAMIAAHGGQSFSQQVMDRLGAGARFLSALQTASGKTPAIGDDDKGRLVTDPSVAEPLYVASVCASVAGLCGLDELAGARPGYFREAIFPRGDAGAARGQQGVNIFRKGGYSIVRQDINQRDVHLTFDHGPLGYLTLAAHGHADALAVWLSIDGQEIFCDAGTWLYHSGEDMRRLIRRSQFHNTLSLPGLSQSEPSAAFSWRNKARCELVSEKIDGMTWSLEGKHDGYLRRKGVVHHRRLARAGNTISIFDHLTGSAEGEDVEIVFFCAPDVQVHREAGSLMLTAGPAQKPYLSLQAPAGFVVTILDGSADSDEAFVSQSFGHRTPAKKIILKGRTGLQPCETQMQIVPPENSRNSVS